MAGKHNNAVHFALFASVTPLTIPSLLMRRSTTKRRSRWIKHQCGQQPGEFARGARLHAAFGFPYPLGLCSQANLDRRVRLGMNLSWFGNIALLVSGLVEMNVWLSTGCFTLLHTALSWQSRTATSRYENAHQPVLHAFCSVYCLQILKIVAFVVSRSYSVLASTIDSLVDILSQILVALASQ
jgi:hypothetical protein